MTDIYVVEIWAFAFLLNFDCIKIFYFQIPIYPCVICWKKTHRHEGIWDSDQINGTIA